MQGLEHANYAAAAENLSSALQCKGQVDEARTLMHRALEARSTHMGARHPVVAVTLRKLAELELAAAAAEEQAAAAAAAEEQAAAAAAAEEQAAAAAAEKAGTAAGAAVAAAVRDGATSSPSSVQGRGTLQQEQVQPLRDRERQQAVAIAQEALSIAQQAQHESLEWQRRQGQPEEGGGLLAWLRPAKPQLKLSNMRRPQRPDSTALEVALCLQTLSRAHAATQQGAAAAADLEQALGVLAEAFPAAAAAAAGSSSRSSSVEAQAYAEAEAGAAAAPASNSSQAAEGGQPVEEGEGEGGDAASPAAASAAAAISAREQARAERVEKARHQLACSLLAELLALAQQGEGGGGGRPDAQRARQRFAQEGCA